MATEYSKQTCPGCRGTSVCSGNIVNVTWFRPSDAGFFSANYTIGAFACLDCGLVAQYLNDAGLEKLRGKQA